MKRLIKKSEIFDGIISDGIHYEIFKNPTDKEINIIREVGDGIRGLIYDDGTKFIWNANFWHKRINKYIGGIDINQFRFAYSGTWEFNLQQKYTFEEAYDIIMKNKDFLNKIGNLNSGINIGYTPDNKVIVANGIDDLKNKIEQKSPAMAKIKE